MTASRAMCMMQMHYFYEMSKSGLVSRTKGSGWPESRDGCLYSPRIQKGFFSETGLPTNIVLGNTDKRKARTAYTAGCPVIDPCVSVCCMSLAGKSCASVDEPVRGWFNFTATRYERSRRYTSRACRT